MVKALNLTWKVFVLAMLLVLETGISPNGAGYQTAPGEGLLYLTKIGPAPEGAVLAPLDLGLSLYTTIFPGLSFPETILCSADGRLTVTETFAQASVGAAATYLFHKQVRFVDNPERTFHRIVRFNQDGSARNFIVEWDSLTLQPSAVVLALSGELFLGTTSRQDGRTTDGLWRMRANGQPSAFDPPQMLIPAQAFLSPLEQTGYSVRPLAFLTQGPFQEDLLVIDAPVQSFVPGGRVLRALAPAYTEVAEFIPAFVDAKTDRPFKPAGLALTPQGRVLVTDFANDKILAFDSNGDFSGVFASLKSPNQIAVGPDGLVYVTNLEFRGVNVTGGLFIFDPQGNLLTFESSPVFLRGVTVCAP